MKHNPRNAGRKPENPDTGKKEKTTITIDAELKARAKAAGINLSKALEEKLRELLGEENA